ncbi:hypothetical protein GWI33_015207 [Rhynchophorus ferrugineus]|uniref:Uncharacterized protein n=1 Tax=Rhynchophorus ferrugineus TaxID=354439 RepID=A0A834I3Q2_RHYFE|nr:hypothetical protein GWI33_015207 [Rhynchophorus ferrugineus]
MEALARDKCETDRVTHTHTHARDERERVLVPGVRTSVEKNNSLSRDRVVFSLRLSLRFSGLDVVGSSDRQQRAGTGRGQTGVVVRVAVGYPAGPFCSIGFLVDHESHSSDYKYVGCRGAFGAERMIVNQWVDVCGCCEMASEFKESLCIVLVGRVFGWS